MSTGTPPGNPLLAPLLALLQQASGSYKVHELLAELRRQGAIPTLSEDEQLQLFRVNFLIMNALYQLQEELYEEGWWLVISTLDIRLEARAGKSTDEKAMAHNHSLRDYYCDWQVFWQTDRKEVEALLNRFWQGLNGEENRREALALFGLAADATRETIRQRWRVLALRHHPDRGGDAEAFMRIRWAWECLRG